MRLYLDDDSASVLLTKLLRQAGHDVQRSVDAGMSGAEDPVHLIQAVRQDRVLLTHNHRDFENLHHLIMEVKGHHPGLLVVRKDNDPKRDLTAAGEVRAIGKLLAAGVPIADHCYVLNQWRSGPRSGRGPCAWSVFPFIRRRPIHVVGTGERQAGAVVGEAGRHVEGLAAEAEGA